ncbi:MAG: triose-phosphate isomerase [Bacteroidetes bacterium]|nr:triose-phosphate isomerase [Bacteroidota bacterium]
MKRKKIVAGNWKMNTTKEEAEKLAASIVQSSQAFQGVEKIVFPPFPFLQAVKTIVNNTANFFVGAQNCNHHDKGAYTGEVSAAMLKSVGCDYVLIGHSERRQYFTEDNIQLLSKTEQALTNNLNVIFCFGEQLNERKNNQHFETVKKQLHGVLNFFPKNKTEQLVLAYEPVWAIGTGETATPAQAQEMHAFIRKTVAEIFSQEITEQISILYGGSCNAQNAPELFSCPDVDGGLIGGASLNADEFCKIIGSFG